VAKDNAFQLNLPTVDSLFSTQEERGRKSQDYIIHAPLTELFDFPNHPFKVRMDNAMLDMVESVKQYGVLAPALVRPKESSGYELIAGHRRKFASELAEINTIPCIVRNLTDDEATILMVDSNLQRERILPSEKAFAYKMKLDAMRRQAGRPSKNNSVPVGQNYGKTSRQALADDSPDSNTQIQRYIRLTELIPEILDMVDENEIAFRPAVELSHLSTELQAALLDTMQSEDCTPSLAQAIEMKGLAAKGSLNIDVILAILNREKPNQVEQFKIPAARISKYFSAGTPAEAMTETIVKALELYRKRERARER
jgi:ParB-like partition proteins